MAGKPPWERKQTWADRKQFWIRESLRHDAEKQRLVEEFTKFAKDKKADSKEALKKSEGAIKALLKRAEAQWKSLAAENASGKNNPGVEIKMVEIEDNIDGLHRKLAFVQERIEKKRKERD